MARSRETKIELTAYDDLFQTDESREEAKLSKIRDIPISEIDEFPDHPFKVLMDEDMEQLVESIKRKVDEDYPDNKLSGAVFEVYSDTNGDGKLDKDDTLLGEMKELDGGVYQMSELRYGKYLVKESKAPTGFVLDEDVYAVSIEENGKTYTVENKAGVGFINAAQKGSLKIVKTSSDGKVEDFSFRVTGVDYDKTFKTDKNGEIVIEGLRIGDYTVSEVNDKASAGYILPADKQVTVKVDATAIVQMHNEFRDTPKTGDDFNLGLWVSLSVLSVVGAGVLGFVGYKNRKKKKED